MRTSLVEIAQIENWLLKRGNPQGRLLTEAKILCSPDLKEKVHLQSASYEAIHQYGREKLFQEIRAVEYRLFHSSKHRSFQNRIRAIFKH